MDLLVLKVGEKYIRVISDDHELVGLSKASVFSFSDEERVLNIYNKLRLEYTEITIMKLVVTERNYFDENHT